MIEPVLTEVRMAAIAAEAPDLASVPRWATPDEDLEHTRPALVDESDDVLIYLNCLANLTHAGVGNEASARIGRNALRYLPPAMEQAT